MRMIQNLSTSRLLEIGMGTLPTIVWIYYLVAEPLGGIRVNVIMIAGFGEVLLFLLWILMKRSHHT